MISLHYGCLRAPTVHLCDGTAQRRTGDAPGAVGCYHLNDAGDYSLWGLIQPVNAYVSCNLLRIRALAGDGIIPRPPTCLPHCAAPFPSI